MNKKIILKILVLIIILPVVLFDLGYLLRAPLEFLYEDVMFNNTSTVLFQCSDFPDERAAVVAISEKSDPKFNRIENLYRWIERSEVGIRCPGKYQIDIYVDSELNRFLLRINLFDQKLNNIPVFIRKYIPAPKD